MAIKGIRYFIDAEGENIISFAIEVAEFRKAVNHDIIARYHGVYIYVSDKMTSEDVVGEYYKLRKDN